MNQSLFTYFNPQTDFHLDYIELLDQNGFMSALPYLGMWLFEISAGQTADLLRTRKHMSTTRVRKLFSLVGRLSSLYFSLN